MLTHTVDETAAIKRAFQIVPKYQLAAPSIARKEQGTVAGKMDRKKKTTLNLHLGESSLRILIDSIKSAESRDTVNTKTH